MQMSRSSASPSNFTICIASTSSVSHSMTCRSSMVTVSGVPSAALRKSYDRIDDRFLLFPASRNFKPWRHSCPESLRNDDAMGNTIFGDDYLTVTVGELELQLGVRSPRPSTNVL